MWSEIVFSFHGNHSFSLPIGEVHSKECEQQRLCHPKSENVDVYLSGNPELMYSAKEARLKGSVETDTGPYQK
jgi:hypothetical protein